MRNINTAPLLCRYGDHYEWNKVVTCIHNVLSQQRWLEHYGEVVIRNTESDVCTCKITFVKVRTEPHQRLTVKGDSTWAASQTNTKLQKGWFYYKHIYSPILWSRAIGPQTTARTRSRGWSWTGLERWSIASEACGMRAFSVTPCPHQSASGSPVRSLRFAFLNTVYLLEM